jgi:hypothetical protein
VRARQQASFRIDINAARRRRQVVDANDLLDRADLAAERRSERRKAMSDEKRPLST